VNPELPRGGEGRKARKRKKEEKKFFFEKKNQKTFVHEARLLQYTYSINQKFFASFFQKRSAFFCLVPNIPISSPAPPPPAAE
jgi:hypothetical protein